MFRLASLLLILSATTAAAQMALTAEEFEDRVTGRTLDFGYDGQTPYGLERYMANRKVLWSWGDGTCQAGRWYEEEGNICFVYDHEPRPQCWRYFDVDGGIMAIFMNEGAAGGTVVYEMAETDREMICGNLGV